MARQTRGSTQNGIVKVDNRQQKRTLQLGSLVKRAYIRGRVCGEGGVSSGTVPVMLTSPLRDSLRRTYTPRTSGGRIPLLRGFAAYLGSWIGAIADGVREWLGMFKRDADESVPKWVVTRTLLGFVLIPLMLVGLVCGLLAVAAIGVILASFFVGLGIAIITGSPISDEIPDATASLGVLVGLAGLMLGDEPVDRLGMLCVGVVLAVGAFIY